MNEDNVTSLVDIIYKLLNVIGNLQRTINKQNMQIGDMIRIERKETFLNHKESVER